jgi:hypothetical protein
VGGSGGSREGAAAAAHWIGRGSSGAAEQGRCGTADREEQSGWICGGWDEKLGFHSYLYDRGICYRAAIGPPNFGSCFGPARRAEVAAQALKGHRAGPALSPMIVPRAGLGSCFLGSCLVPPIVPDPFGILYPALPCSIRGPRTRTTQGNRTLVQIYPLVMFGKRYRALKSNHD